jgi:hypothetical protein
LAVRYKLQIRPEDREYLHRVDVLTREGRIRLFVGLNAVAEVSDEFRTDPLIRPDPDAPYFLYSYLFQDGDRVRALTLAVDDSAALYGVLLQAAQPM